MRKSGPHEGANPNRDVYTRPRKHKPQPKVETPKRHKTTLEERRQRGMEIVKMAQAGMTRQQVADRLGVGLSTIQQAAREFGVHFAASQKEALYKKIKSLPDLSVREAAKQLNISPTTVQRIRTEVRDERN
ncbi:helix-turn-helix domain-containing protein [Lacticaseibacillus hulanensis]|uniref:helix-turn-helix domain-containing protein n=1 Tax=Lacticaseibacillus hulanensis TaxID=2493111 RepID=UPI003BAD1603